jgi:putative transposase
MSYNSNLHHRRSVRLKGYDYSQAGMYFVTICVQDKVCLFGEIIDDEMLLNDAGKMIEKWYFELENKFSDIECGVYVVMPNHFHAIIINNGNKSAPDDAYKHKLGGMGLVEHAGSPLPEIVQWFKTMTTNDYIRGVKTLGWQRFTGKLWQRNYWEHVIRDQKSFDMISEYIINNPKNWPTDKLNNQ